MVHISLIRRLEFKKEGQIDRGFGTCMREGCGHSALDHVSGFHDVDAGKCRIEGCSCTGVIIPNWMSGISIVDYTGRMQFRDGRRGTDGIP